LFTAQAGPLWRIHRVAKALRRSIPTGFRSRFVEIAGRMVRHNLDAFHTIQNHACSRNTYSSVLMILPFSLVGNLYSVSFAASIRKLKMEPGGYDPL